MDYVESKGGREVANFALARASQTFVKVNGVMFALVYLKNQMRGRGTTRIIRLYDALYVRCRMHLLSIYSMQDSRNTLEMHLLLQLLCLDVVRNLVLVLLKM